MEKTAFKDKKWAIYLSAFMLPFLMMQIFWVLNRIYPYGGNSILTGDMDLEFVNFYGYFINTFKGRSDWSYMLAKTLGGDFPGLAAFQLHDPLLFILFLFPGEKIAAGIELVFTLQVSLAGLSMSVLLNRRIKKSWMSLLFSTAYAFSGFFFGYLVLTIYHGCLALLPLVVYFLLKYLEDGKYVIPYVLVTVLYIYMNFHMGFMLVIFLCILYVSRIIEDKEYLKKAPAFIGSGITILLTDGFFLIRTGLSLLGEKTTEGADYGFYRRFAMNQLFAGFFSGCEKNEYMPLIYCSVFAVFSALIYLMTGNNNIRRKLADMFVVAVVAVSMWINTIDAVWHGFNNPEGFYFRYAFFISFMVVVMGYRGFISLKEDTATIPKAIMAAGIMILYMIWLKISGNVYLDTVRLVINVFLTAAILVLTILILKGGKAEGYAWLFLTLICAADMLYNSKTAYLNLNSDEGRLPEMARFREDYTSIDDVISYIKDLDDGFYRIEKDFDRAVNDPALFDYMGMSHDSSCEKDEVIDWLNNFGFPRTVYYTYYNGGGTSFTDLFFGIRYYVSRFDETAKPYKILPYGGKYHVFLNEYALPIAYVAPDGLTGYGFEEGDTFKKQNDLAAFWAAGDDIYLEAEAAVTCEGANETEPGHYVKNSDEAFVVYDIKISEDMPLYLYFEAPKRQGAELFINGEDRDRYFSENHWNVLCAGNFKPGDTVNIKLKLLEDELYVDKACFCYENTRALKAWADKAASLNRGIGDIEEITSSHLLYKTDNDTEKTVVMSVPYDSGWKVTCDGARLKTDKAMQVLMSYNIPAGEHVIEMKYVPHGTVAGLIVSIAGVIMFVILSYVTIRSGRKKEAVSDTEAEVSQ